MFETIEYSPEEITALQRLARWRSDPKIETFTKYSNFPVSYTHLTLPTIYSV